MKPLWDTEAYVCYQGSTLQKRTSYLCELMEYVHVAFIVFQSQMAYL